MWRRPTRTQMRAAMWGARVRLIAGSELTELEYTEMTRLSGVRR